jgi:uncharacterized protein involved in exopolysaccharide biosynthesis
MPTTEHPLIVQGDEVSAISLIAVMWRYKLLVAGCGFLFALAAVYLAFTTPFVYRAEVVVAPVNQNDTANSGSLAGQLGGLASLAGLPLPNGGGTQEAQAMLRSRYLAEMFITKNKLVPRILGGGGKQSLWIAVDRLRRLVVSTDLDKETGTTTVAMKWKDPREVAIWANQYVALANDILRNRELEDASRNIRFLNEQISKTQVVEIQRALYGLVENETKKQMLASTRTEYAFTVIDPAVVPEERIWPRRSLMLLTGGALGLILGTFAALGHNLWQRHRMSVVG